jgi:hypothetical protein
MARSATRCARSFLSRALSTGKASHLLLALRAMGVATVAVGTTAAGAHAGNHDLPRVWTWAPATGPAASHPSLRPLTLVTINATSTPAPATVADTICDLILARGLGEGEVAITILNYGRNTLVGHPLDAMQGTGLPSNLERGTPWTANGLAATSAWTDAFIARYQERQAADGVPAPARLHMDSELRLPNRCFLPDVSICWGTAPLEVFDAMRADPRWSTEPLRMNPGLVPTPRTMAELYESAGSPAYDPALPRDAEANRAWSTWWDGVMRESVDGALDAALYSRAKAAWPGVRSSEFAQSMRLDGGIEPDGSTRGYTDFEWWNEGWMPRTAWCGRADLQAPAFYVFGETFVDPALSFMDGQMHLHRANLDACLHSFGGVAPSEVTPWVTLPEVDLPFGESPATSRSYTRDEFLRILALFRSRGLDEFMVWPSGNDSVWSAATSAIDAAWSPRLVSAIAASGSVSPEAAELLRLGERVPCAVVPTKAGFDLRASFTTTAESHCGDSGSLWIAVEGSSAADAIWTVELLRTDGSWQEVDAAFIRPGDQAARWIGPLAATGLIDTSAGPGEASVVIRIRSESNATASLDLLQLVHWPHSRGDVNRDGSVDSVDIALVLANWSTSDPTTDLNGDGVVNSADLTVVLSDWGPGCR